MADDVFTVNICPLCKESHTYSLEVERSSTQLGGSNVTKAISSKSFKRLLTCPVKNETFLATIELRQNVGEVIRNVTIAGII